MRVSHETEGKGPLSVVTVGPWQPRDASLAETAITLDRLTAKLERLERREDALVKQVAELSELAQQAGRFQALAESLRNSRDYKLEETVKVVRELRGRIEAIEGPRAEFAGITHRSLVAVDRALSARCAREAAAEPKSRRSWRLGGGVAAILAGVLLMVLSLPLV